MFYCHECAQQNNWDETIHQQMALCHMCGQYNECSEVHGKFLSMPVAIPMTERVYDEMFE